MDDISHRPRQEIFEFPNEASQKIDAPNFYPMSEIFPIVSFIIIILF